MFLPWININSRLQSGVALINSISRTKFELILKRIIQAENEQPFTQSEVSKLSESLSIDEKHIQLLVQSIAHIFRQSLKVILKPTILLEQLVEQIQLNEDKAQIFVELWTIETKKNFDVEKSKNLDNLSWELNVETASKFCNKENFINVRLQLGLVSVDGHEKENLTLELDEDELQYLYTTLEKIQNKLDGKYFIVLIK